MITAGQPPSTPATAVQQSRKDQPVRNLGMRDCKSPTSNVSRLDRRPDARSGWRYHRRYLRFRAAVDRDV